jgi:hypothetical protein
MSHRGRLSMRQLIADREFSGETRGDRARQCADLFGTSQDLPWPLFGAWRGQCHCCMTIVLVGSALSCLTRKNCRRIDGFSQGRDCGKAQRPGV